MNRSSANTYPLHEREDGSHTPHWQILGHPQVPGVTQGQGGQYPPPFPIVVVAEDVTQACYFANKGVRADENGGHGIVWERAKAGETHPPLAANMTPYHAVIAWFGRDLTIWLGETQSDAELMASELGRFVCLGQRCREYEIVEMTLAEARRMKPVWLVGPFSIEAVAR